MSIDFDAIAGAALARAESICAELFPAGRKDGHEFKVGGLGGEAGTSLSINLRTGRWKDFAAGDSGSDLIALWAAARSIGMGDAARELSDKLGAGAFTAAAKALSQRAKSDPSEWESQPHGPDTPAPTTKRINRDGVWQEHQVAASWAYRDAEGRLVGYVCRVNFSDGSKEVFPYAFARHKKTGREEWRWKGFPKPRPLYGLDRLAKAAPEVGVLIVEGEKSTDAAQRLVPGIVCLTWPGGADGIRVVDLEPLRGRRVTLWPDADSHRWGERETRPAGVQAGDLKPLAEQPGFRAMVELADRLEGIAASTVILPPPAGKQDGWDLADAEAEGWDEQRVRAHVRACREASTKPAETTPPQPDAPDELPEHPGEPVDDAPPADLPPAQPPSNTPSEPLSDAPFRWLGFAQGKHFYLSHKTGQVFDLSASEHTKLNLLELAPLAWWGSMFAGDKGPDWTMAANALIQRSKALDVFDSRRVRGRGAWIDRDRVVFHAGNELIVEGEAVGIGRLESDYVYTRGIRLPHYGDRPASNAEAARLLTLCESLSWRHPLSAKLLAGWCALAPVCGALNWRPHVWVSGKRGTGKTTVINRIVRPILGWGCLAIVGNTTEPGIRQHLGCDALPILYDEAEAESKRGQERMQAVLEFARPCSSESEAVVAKGTASGTGMQYKPRSMICFSSIGVAATQAADTSRIAVLELVEYGPGWQEHFRGVEAVMGETVARDEYCGSIRARSLSLARVTRDNARTFARVVGARLNDARMGDQIGTLLAGAYSLTSRNIVDSTFASEWVGMQDWSFFEPHEADSDHNRAFTALVDAHVRIEQQDGPAITRTVGELVEESLRDRTTAEDAQAVLMRHGMRVMLDQQMLAVANGHQFLARVFADSPWAGKHKDQLARLPGATASEGVIAFGPGSRHRAVLVPLAVFRS